MNIQRNQWLILGMAVGILVGRSTGLNAAQAEKSSNKHFCENKVLGVRYFCAPDWKQRNIKDAVLIVISSDPAVTLTITKIDSNIQFVEQLTKSMLEAKGLYADGFRLSNVEFAGQPAVRVQAFSKQYKDRRLLDYYFMYNGELYAVLFSVYPKDKWDDYKFLIKNIGESIELID